MKKQAYPIEREALRQLHLQVASARFDRWSALERAARRAIKAVAHGEEAVGALDDEAADVLRAAKRSTIRIRPSADEPALELPPLGAAS